MYLNVCTSDSNSSDGCYKVYHQLLFFTYLHILYHFLHSKYRNKVISLLDLVHFYSIFLNNPCSLVRLILLTLSILWIVSVCEWLGYLGSYFEKFFQKCVPDGSAFWDLPGMSVKAYSIRFLGSDFPPGACDLVNLLARVLGYPFKFSRIL